MNWNELKAKDPVIFKMLRATLLYGRTTEVVPGRNITQLNPDVFSPKR